MTGKPNKNIPIDIQSLCRAYTDASIKTLGAYATNDETDASIRLRAIEMILDRGWGRPKQDNTHTLSGEVRVILRKMLDDEVD